MQRRQVVGYLGAALALPFLPRNAEAAIALGERLHERVDAWVASREVEFRTLNAAQQALVTEICEAIIPETDTPGATSVRVAQFIDLLLTEWMSDDERTAFLGGLDGISATGFARHAVPEKTRYLATLDAARTEAGGPAPTFGRLKALTVYAYFTAPRIQRDVLHTQMFFDGYRGDVPFTPIARS